MTFTTTFTNEDIRNLAKIAAEIEPTFMTEVYDAFAHETIIDCGHVKASITNGNTASVEISPELFGYYADNMLDIIASSKMIGRVLMRMFGDNLSKYIKEPVIIKDGVEISKKGNPDLENIRVDDDHDSDPIPSINPDLMSEFDKRDDGSYNV